MKLIVVSVVLFVLALSYKSCQGVPSKDPDGSIIWDPLPSLGSFDVEPDQYKRDGNRPATLASMSSGWVDFIQPKGFPIDYIVHLIEMLTANDPVVIMDEVFLGMKNFVGIIVCFLIGFFFFLLLPLIALFFCCCRFCNNCGGKREQEDKNLCCKQICLSVAFTTLLAILCAGAVSIDTSYKFMTTAKDVSFESAVVILDDLKTFTNGSAGQLSHILQDEYKYVEALTVDDLQNAGKLIAEPVQDYLLKEVKVQALYDEFDKLINDVDDASTTLQAMNASRSSLIMAGDSLDNQLADVSDSLANIDASCGCVPPNNGLTVNIDFRLLPVFDDQINGAAIAKSNITDIYDAAVQALNQIATDIDTVAEVHIDEIESVIATTSDQINDVYSSVDTQLSSISDILVDIEDILKDWLAFADQYLIYRDYSMLALALIGFIIFGIFCVGLIMGSIFSKDIDPRDRSAGANCCGNFLMFGVVLTFLLTPLLMLFTSLFFVSLAPVTLTCKPLKNLKLINETVDKPGLISDGYFLADLVLGNSSIPLTFTSLLEECDKNSTIYSALKLEHVLNINNLENILNELRDQTDKLVDEIDLGDVNLGDLVPENLGVVLQLAVDQMQLKAINFNTLETLLQDDVTTDNLHAYAAELDTAAGNNPTFEANLTAEAERLRQINSSTVVKIEEIMTSMLSDSHHTNDLITILERDVNATDEAGAVVKTGLTDTTSIENELDMSVEGYIDGVIGYLDQYIDIAIEQLVEDFAKCYPIRAIYDASINIMCRYDLDSLNTFWFSLGWCVFWMMVSLIFAVKLAKYLHIMDTVKVPKNRVQDGTDTEEGRGNSGNQRNAFEMEEHGMTNNAAYGGPPKANAPPYYTPPPSYEESINRYSEEVEC